MINLSRKLPSFLFDNKEFIFNFYISNDCYDKTIKDKSKLYKISDKDYVCHILLGLFHSLIYSHTDSFKKIVNLFGNKITLLNAHSRLKEPQEWKFRDGENYLLVQDWINNYQTPRQILIVGCCNTKFGQYDLNSEKNPLIYPKEHLYPYFSTQNVEFVCPSN